MGFIAIPSGTFLMGSHEGQEDEAPIHRVQLDAFEIAVFPVTRRDYAAFLSATSHPAPRDWQVPEFSGDDLPVVGVSWTDATAGPLPGPWPVSRGAPNHFGIHGIAANIHEWCADWHAHEYYAQSPTVNPLGPPAGSRKVSRGGSWRHSVTISRTAARSKLDPSFRYTDYGFRVAR
ncbi:MAG: formylglycine-generating enzyme family protein [Acidobacteria bacterium]|nr:formylglycine-generating enzyme family protein [Acidobacteriota bacterium]